VARDAPVAGVPHVQRQPGAPALPPRPHIGFARTGSGERGRMARLGSGERQRIGRLSIGDSSGSGGGQGRAGSVPLHERFGSFGRQGSLAARQGLQRLESVGASARQSLSRSASVVGASASRVASNPANYLTSDGDLYRLTSMT